jgi:hypothetical protein
VAPELVPEGAGVVAIEALMKSSMWSCLPVSRTMRIEVYPMSRQLEAYMKIACGAYESKYTTAGVWEASAWCNRRS